MERAFKKREDDLRA